MSWSYKGSGCFISSFHSSSYDFGFSATFGGCSSFAFSMASSTIESTGPFYYGYSLPLWAPEISPSNRSSLSSDLYFIWFNELTWIAAADYGPNELVISKMHANDP